MNDIKALSDPRLRPDFDPAYLPLCDGGPLPPVGTADVQLRRVIEFAALYFAMNRAQDAAEASRALGDGTAERIALKEICRLSRERDALEDRLAPEGFLAEPVMNGSRYINLRFTWAGKPVTLLCVQRFEAEFTL